MIIDQFDPHQCLNPWTESFKESPELGSDRTISSKLRDWRRAVPSWRVNKSRSPGM